MNILWTFKCFKNGKGKIAVIDWLKNELSTKAWQNAKRSMENLAQREITEWHKPNPASKIGKSTHIYVIRFKDENRSQWRIYGFHDTKKYIFVMTNYGTERDGKYIPPIRDITVQAESARTICNSSWDRNVCDCIKRSLDSNSLSISDQCIN